MKKQIPTIQIMLFVVLSNWAMFSQTDPTDEQQIRAIRQASNQALKSYETEEVLSYLTDDVLTTTGSGTLLCGKKALEDYISEGGNSRMYWIRETQEIRVTERRELAWERGSWKGYDPEKSKEPIVHGEYSAQWTKEMGVWKIRSQLFVTLGEEEKK